jgi:hypothetical protein
LHGGVNAIDWAYGVVEIVVIVDSKDRFGTAESCEVIEELRVPFFDRVRSNKGSLLQKTLGKPCTIS